MRDLLLVAAGGALGSVVRWRVGQALAVASRDFPWGTLAVNVAGSLVLGLVFARWPAGRPSAWRLLLGVGFCGGFTTFSTFGVETVALAQRGLGERAAVYALGSVALGAIAVLLGLALGRTLTAR